MATIDYKEKYMQALERARQFSEKPYLEDSAGIVEYIFPELKESEDEKIRNTLIKIIRNTTEKELFRLYDVHQKNVIAWLEKQGEQKTNYCHHEVDLSDCSEEYRKAYYDGWNNCNMQHSQCKSELDDVVKCLINGMKFYYEDNGEATWGTDKWSMPVKHIIEVLERQGEKGANGNEREIPNSSWSEEDEMRFNNIFTLLEELPLSQNWFKNIKDRVQPRQEWSEGDKRIIDNLISQLGNLYVRKLIKEETKDKYVNWLKSLRHKTTWKPSEEQMEALYEETQKSDRIKDYRIVSLYNDLKKLMER